MDPGSASAPPSNPGLDEPIRWSPLSGSFIRDSGESTFGSHPWHVYSSGGK